MLGEPGWPAELVEDFYYGAVWSECCAVNRLSLCLFDRQHALWSDMDRYIIDFISANSLAVALWCYYKPVSKLVLKCKHLFNSELPTDVSGNDLSLWIDD